MSCKCKEVKIKFAKVEPNAIIPTKNQEDAGYDIYSCFEEDYLVIPSLETVLVPTGLASALPDTHYFQIQERGSTGSKGMKYGAGVIDSSYRGAWFVPITNCTNKDMIITDKPLSEIIIKEFERGYDNCIRAVQDAMFYLKYNGGSDEDVTLDNVMHLLLTEEDFAKSIMIYPKEKAICQAVLLEVPTTIIEEISYEELQKIPSKRGTGVLGSSGK